MSIAQRQLAKAEENLGLLGWQQADFDEPTQRQVDALQNIEREQASLSNRSAELAHELTRVGENRAKVRREYEQKREVLEGDRNAARKPLSDSERKLAAARDHTPDVDRKTAQLDRELRDIEELSTKLLVVQPQPIHVRDEILRLRDRALAIQNERNDLKTQHARSRGEIHHLEQQIATLEKKVAEIEKALRELKAAFEEEDVKLEEEERGLAEEKAKTEKQINELERAKGNPYRAIGRVLADNGIAPMNQPAALQNVFDLRDRNVAFERELDDLYYQTQSMDRTRFWVSVGLWGSILAAATLVAAALR